MKRVVQKIVQKMNVVKLMVPVQWDVGMDGWGKDVQNVNMPLMFFCVHRF